ncbi:MAG: hypothetical protein ACTSPD_10420 [Promethearchaeota archaeon]
MLPIEVKRNGKPYLLKRLDIELKRKDSINHWYITTYLKSLKRKTQTDSENQPGLK